MNKILIANRGEIALRVMRTVRQMGIKTVAIYSEADRNAPHVLFADESVCVGPPPSSESYLLGDKIIQAAKKINVAGIHPGYGFLSENAQFAMAVEGNGMIFIGPSPESIEIMGNKLAAKEAVKKYDIPMVPGVDRAITDVELAKDIAKDIGFPVLIKAAAGGGGKGMRVVKKEEDLEEQMNRAVSEAVSSFGDGSVFIEKYISSPRHIEIQILADQFGNTVHLFERECSIQRRHQKVIEEAPSAILTPEIRAAMGKDAINVAKSCNYKGAGTVEFLVDENMKYYFLEMNTRLQVEHPVTELITGLDLVEQQIKIARGETLSFSQNDLKIKGHAVEIRVYAEDPTNDFLPNVGTLTKYRRPEGNGIRLDDGYSEGMEIPIYYDPMLSKLITHGKTRNDAIQKMLKAIDLYQIEGVTTTLSFGRFVFQHEAFLSGNFNTHFIEKYFDSDSIKFGDPVEAELAGLLATHLYEKETAALKVPNHLESNWKKNRPAN
jgi:propionyl-CoA carboxylase alpha chain